VKPWKRIDPTEDTKFGFRHIVTKTFAMPDGRTQTYHTKDSEDTIAIGVIALTPENEVIIAHQFRPGPEKMMDEIPGGGAYQGEGLEEAARRELLEETGYEPGKFSFLGQVNKDAYTNTVWHYFLALDCKKVDEQALDENEFIEVKLITIDQLFKNARQGKMTDVSAVFLAYPTLLKLQK
jgi:ADP-ribose pyrophosphatase